MWSLSIYLSTYLPIYLFCSIFVFISSLTLLSLSPSVYIFQFFLLTFLFLELLLCLSHKLYIRLYALQHNTPRKVRWFVTSVCPASAPSCVTCGYQFQCTLLGVGRTWLTLGTSVFHLKFYRGRRQGRIWLTCKLLSTGIHKYKWLFWLRFSTFLWSCRAKESPRNFLGGRGVGRGYRRRWTGRIFFSESWSQNIKLFNTQIICPNFLLFAWTSLYLSIRMNRSYTGA